MNRLFLNSNRTEYKELYCILGTLRCSNEPMNYLFLFFFRLKFFRYLILYLKIAL